MEIGLFMNTHGYNQRDDVNFYLQYTPVEEIRPVEVAQRAEQLGYHSLWFSDHVTLTTESTSGHVANETRTRAYQPIHNMLDGAVTMGAIASVTNRIKMSPSVLIAPYRGPLNDARQFATLDQLSKGRVIMSVGAGWMKEEFDVIGWKRHEDRGEVTDECIEIYKRSWMDKVVSFHGKHYHFDSITMDPKPYQKPRPPIIFGSVVPAGARRAACLCDGFFPIMLDTYVDPFRFSNLQDIIRREAGSIGKDLSQFWMIVCASAMAVDAKHPWAQKKPRPNCTGTADQILADLEQYAKAGYGLVILHFHVASNTYNEYLDMIERVGKEVIPQAKAIKPTGEWKRDL